MNILFLFTDQQNRYALGCMGNPNIETPVLDDLASRGVLFRRCYSNDPVCGPFRGSLLTGQYTSRCRVVHNGSPLPKGVPTIADGFNDAGYGTSWVGKWHLGGNGNGPIPVELRGGFQEFIGYQCYNGFTKDVCFYDGANEEHRFEKHRTDVTTDLAIDRLHRFAQQGRPFLLMVSYQAPHYPVQPSPEYAERYRNRPIIHRPNCRDVDPYTPTFSPPSPKPAEMDPDWQRYGNDLDEYIRLYNAMCTQVDSNVGRLLDTLEGLGIAGETIVFFTSDHGDMQGSHGQRNKCLPHEESSGIPLIVSGPGVDGGRVSDALVSGIDMMPTLLDLAGAPPVQGVDGRSFAPLLRGETERGCDAIFSERDKWCMIVTEDWKLVAERQQGDLIPTMLINLQEDPYELSNRVGDDSVIETQRDLFSRLKSWDREVRPSAAARVQEDRP